MIRKSILSILGGVLFAAALTFASPAKAACAFFCADRIGDYVFQGCVVGVDHVTCFYTYEPPPPDNPIITD
jgi:hypothetical protein